MDNFIIKLYKKFLYGRISRDEFLEMRYNINSADEDALSQLLEQEWEEGIVTEKLQPKSKLAIRKNLEFYIENDQKQFDKRKMLQIAAVVVPFLALSTYLLSVLFIADKQGDFIVSVERGNKATVTLPDESKVWMNSNSTLEYGKGKKNIRKAKLTGEAFFRVAKNEKQPFVVTLNNLNIEVLGTSFNAKARRGSDIIETSLVEGSIRLHSPDLPQDYYLKPNEKAIFSQSKKQLQIISTDNELETAWKENKLKFSSERFIDVLAMIEDWYGVKIINKYPEIEEDMMSGTLKDENLETALDALKIQYNIDFVRKRDTIYVVRKR